MGLRLKKIEKPGNRWCLTVQFCNSVQNIHKSVLDCHCWPLQLIRRCRKNNPSRRPMFEQGKKLWSKMNLSKVSPVDMTMSLVSLGDFPVLTNCIHLSMDLPGHSGQVSVVYSLIAGLVTGSQGDDNYKPRPPIDIPLPFRSFQRVRDEYTGSKVLPWSNFSLWWILRWRNTANTWKYLWQKGPKT